MCGVTGGCVAGALSALQAARRAGVLQDRQRICAAIARSRSRPRGVGSASDSGALKGKTYGCLHG